LSTPEIPADNALFMVRVYSATLIFMVSIVAGYLSVQVPAFVGFLLLAGAFSFTVLMWQWINRKMKEVDTRARNN